jgi:hypothetical protein
VGGENRITEPCFLRIYLQSIAPGFAAIVAGHAQGVLCVASGGEVEFRVAGVGQGIVVLGNDLACARIDQLEVGIEGARFELDLNLLIDLESSERVLILEAAPLGMTGIGGTQIALEGMVGTQGFKIEDIEGVRLVRRNRFQAVHTTEFQSAASTGSWARRARKIGGQKARALTVPNFSIGVASNISVFTELIRIEVAQQLSGFT